MKKTALIPAALLAAAPLAAQENGDTLALDTLRAYAGDNTQTAAQDASLPMTKDEGPAADISPKAHAEQYAKFKQCLKEEAKACNYDFVSAMEAVLSATNDEFAVEQWMQAAAKENIAPAMQYLANQSFARLRVNDAASPAAKAAFALEKKAADAGYTPAMLNVGMARMQGLGTEKDETQARKDLMNACKAGHFVTRFKWLMLTKRLKDWDSRELPEVKAEVNRGNHHVVYELAMYAPTAKDKMEWLQKAVKLGNSEATYTLSTLASENAPKESYELLKEAAKMHNVRALHLMGCMIMEPNPPARLKELDVPHNDKLGRHFIRLAAMLDNADSRYLLALAYHKGLYGFKKDDTRAFRHMESAANLGDPVCMASVGVMHVMGIGTKKDPEAAVPYIVQAANLGVPGAPIMLAYMQYHGLGGVPADARKARETLQDAQAANIPEALVYLAYLAAKGGPGLEPDEKEAAMYLRMAEMDLKDNAKKLYDSLMKDGWEPEL